MTDAIQLKHIEDAVEARDGIRVLVDRAWPGDVARLQWWARELAPSAQLREWFARNPGHRDDFRRRYRDELAQEPEALSKLLDYCRQGVVTLVFAATERQQDAPAVLREVLREELAEEQRPDDNASPTCYSNQFREYNGLPDED